MAHLPPKVPSSMTPQNNSWPDFCHQKLENLAINNQTAVGLSWVDDFLDFSSAKRSHRRSMSDSIAFLEAPMAEECRRSSSSFMMPPGGGGCGGDANNNNNNNNNSSSSNFDRFDDEQLMSMFADDEVGPNINVLSCSNPSSPSDHNSINDEHDQKHATSSSSLHPPKCEPADQDAASSELGFNNHDINSDCYSNEKIVDPKRIKRILANRQSAQRSRVRKLQYISELERSVSSLQGEVSVLSPRVAFLDHQRLVLNVDNSVLKQRIAALAQDKLFKDAHQEALKREIERLRQIYYQQNMKKMENGNGSKSPPRVSDTNCSAEMEQLAVN
ncbi:hypothetical protein ACP275_13G039500 [Erythranthe tilingii]